MAGIYDEIEIEDMRYLDDEEIFYYPCPCGDKFSISLEELLDGEDIATCPSCTLRIRVIFDIDKLPKPASSVIVIDSGSVVVSTAQAFIFILLSPLPLHFLALNMCMLLLKNNLHLNYILAFAACCQGCDVGLIGRPFGPNPAICTRVAPSYCPVPSKKSQS
eukprot:gene655-1268_t